jgi:hypothetical protein
MKRLINIEVKENQNYAELIPFVELLEQKYVSPDMPLAVVETSKKYKNPVIYGSYNGLPMVRDSEEMPGILSKIKLFKFVVNKETNRVKEFVAGEVIDPNTEFMVPYYLPKETRVDQLVFNDGRIDWLKPVVEQEVN